MSMLWVWVIVIAAAVLFEATSPIQLVSIWAALGGLVSLILCLCNVDMAIQIIETFSSPHVTVDPDQLRYACESTGNWHHPLLRAWGGRPIVINPSIAKAGRRKSDRIDSFILAQNSLMGTWPESFISSPDINVLRMYYQQRRHCERRATQLSNSINSELLRFGVNIARDGSVTRNKEVRAHVIDQLSERPTMEPGRTHDYLPSEDQSG